MPTYNFRLTFLLPEGSIINSNERTLSLGQGQSHGALKLLSLSNNAAINNSRWLGIEGEGYSTPDEAWAEGLRAKTALMLASVERLFGVNCGEDEKVGRVHSSLKEAMGKELKATVLDAVHGLTVYEDVGPVKFVRVEATGVPMRQPEGLVATFDCFFGEHPKLIEEELTCLELVNASSFEPPRAALLTLVTAAEVLCPQQPQPASYRKLVEEIKAMLDSGPAAEPDRQSLKNELERLRPEQSIRSACKSKITSLLGEEAFKRFDEIYGVRSRITHEGTKENVAKWLREARDIVWKLLLASIRSRQPTASTQKGAP